MKNMIFVMAVVMAAVAQGQQAPTAKVERRTLAEATRLSKEDVKALWARVPMSTSVMSPRDVTVEQTLGKMMAEQAGRLFSVQFEGIIPVPGYTIAFGFETREGWTSLGGYKIPWDWDHSLVWENIWEGTFPSAWYRLGPITFKALLVDPAGSHVWVYQAKVTP